MTVSKNKQSIKNSANNTDVILSLTRTSRVGYLRDVRRLTVALSRARLGLYILGRREVFESCFELHEAFDILFLRPDKLKLVTGELWPSKRASSEEKGKEIPGETTMEGVEHLGQYVYEMTNARVTQLRVEQGLTGDAKPVFAAGSGSQESGGYYQDDDEDVADMFKAEE
jgi:intron-binding protein aquarius